MAIVKWEPYNEISTVHHRLNPLFPNPLRSFFDNEGGRLPQDWIPAVDIYEDTDGIKLHVELPGMEEKEISVDLENNVLKVSGERKRVIDDEDGNYRRVERVSGQFDRSFRVPESVDQQKVSAAYKNGILTVDLPKREETKPKNVSIKIQ